MAAESFLLTLCIPTRNHATELKVMLDTLVCLPAFRDSLDIEIAISDNCSTDNTKEVCGFFVARYPERIRYYRNDHDCKDANFEIALSHGRGQYLKLANDTLMFTQSGLTMMVAAVRKNVADRPLLFFSNRQGMVRERPCNGLDEFIEDVSFSCTWIGGFGIWRDDFERLEDFSREKSKMLVQVDVICRHFAELSKHAVAFDFAYCSTIPRGRKGGYSLPQVFGRNYYDVLNKYCRAGFLSRLTLRREMKRVLRNHIVPFILMPSNDFGAEGYVKSMFPVFWAHVLYWLCLPVVYLATLFKRTSSIRRVVSQLCFAWDRLIQPHLMHRLVWRCANQHNATYAMSLFPRGQVSVGNGSYGPLDVFAGSPEARLIIGNYVSIGPDVKFLPAGVHRMDLISTFPFAAFTPEGSIVDIPKGAIVVKDDVWIGARAVVLSGVTIGQGAVVGAGAVVTKDVEPYAVVGGCPARVLKYRFDKNIRDQLVCIDWSLVSREQADKMEDVLNVAVNEENVAELVRRINAG